jgi:hypothetical protein
MTIFARKKRALGTFDKALVTVLAEPINKKGGGIPTAFLNFCNLTN